MFKSNDVKNTLLIITCSLFAINVWAQNGKKVYDQENLFTSGEAAKLDSMLQQYSIRSGNNMFIVSDTADVSVNVYADRLFIQYNSTGKPSLILLMSRKNSLLLIAVNAKLRPYLSQEQMMAMINAGIPSFRDKRTADGAKLICLKAMELLNNTAINTQ